MKTVFLSLISFIASFTQAQTAIIAHKSHSGTSVDFFIDPNTNFGEPGPQLIQIVRLNDSTYVNVYSEFSGFIFHDTVRHKIDYNLNIDSLKQPGYYNNIEYINFKDSPKDLKPKTPGYRMEEMKSQEIIPDETPINEPAPKKKKKSYLLFLFGITGGGMLLMKLFSKSKTTQQSIA
ncbi:hypothetical protein [Fluviicola sp.]|uniref:hypothetical protein n=1 Tax=Fluviicola sp. TaxID=1917219 RepID=UPI003D2B3231